MVGIVSYGTYLPKYRIKISEIAAAWKKNAEEISDSLRIVEKTVPGVDEDAVTVALEAAVAALSYYKGSKIDIETLLVGSESHPYAVNPTSTIVGELLGIGNNYLAADMEFACKAGTAAIQLISGLVATNQIKTGLAVGTDTAQSKPHDVLEYAAASAGVAVLLGKSDVVAELIDFASYSSDTPDFWRRDAIRYPSHAGRFTGEPAYFAHVISSSEKLLKKSKMKPSDFDYCVFHMPNGRFPLEAAKRLGFTTDQIKPSYIIPEVGNPYSASSMLGLAATLDIAKPGQKIFMASYGSGAGSDTFIWKTTKELVRVQKAKIKNKNTVADQIANKKYISYVEYLKQTHKI